VRVDQCLPVFAPRDAIGMHVQQVRKALHAAGWVSDTYAEVFDRELSGQARPWQEAPRGADPGRVWLYHASTYAPMAEEIVTRAASGEQVVVYYHNITPAAYFQRWLPAAAADMVTAREALARLALHARLAIGASAYNTAELAGLGFAPTATSPLLVDLAKFAGVRRGPARRSGSAWLFVGRVAPNKCQHDVIAAFAVYRRLFDPDARLTLVGGATAPLYERALRRLAEELDVPVTLVGGLSDADLIRHFADADVLVCLSEHEGFCVPLVEAMAAGVPVVAYAAAAIPETVAGAGVLVEDKDPLVVARAVADLLADEGRVEELVAAGRRRAASLDLSRSAASLVSLLRAHLGT
jgi:glycosyltransferase involved in cell wall biosynthesis